MRSCAVYFFYHEIDSFSLTWPFKFAFKRAVNPSCFVTAMIYEAISLSLIVELPLAEGGFSSVVGQGVDTSAKQARSPRECLSLTYLSSCSNLYADSYVSLHFLVQLLKKTIFVSFTVLNTG